MKLFELIQIIPTPTRPHCVGNFAAYRISDPRSWAILRNNSIFTFGKADRAKTSATFREILDAMWLFNDKFERARPGSRRSKRRSWVRDARGTALPPKVRALDDARAPSIVT
jgi:hypothetical protein